MEGWKSRIHYCTTPSLQSPTPQLFRQHRQHIDATIAVTPLIVVPSDDLHELAAVGHRQVAVENAGVRVADDVDRNQRLVGIFENAFVALARGGLFERGVD